MLTLKIIHIDIDGGRTTYLFSGERISHIETEYTNHKIEFTSDEPCYFIVGELSGTDSTQPFITSAVSLFDGDDIQQIFILPKSECYVMSDGKTVDTFSCYYK